MGSVPPYQGQPPLGRGAVDAAFQFQDPQRWYPEQGLKLEEYLIAQQYQRVQTTDESGGIPERNLPYGDLESRLGRQPQYDGAAGGPATQRWTPPDSFMQQEQRGYDLSVFNPYAALASGITAPAPASPPATDEPPYAYSPGFAPLSSPAMSFSRSIDHESPTTGNPPATPNPIQWPGEPLHRAPTLAESRPGEEAWLGGRGQQMDESWSQQAGGGAHLPWPTPGQAPPATPFAAAAPPLPAPFPRLRQPLPDVQMHERPEYTLPDPGLSQPNLERPYLGLGGAATPGDDYPWAPETRPPPNYTDLFPFDQSLFTQSRIRYLPHDAPRPATQYYDQHQGRSLSFHELHSASNSHPPPSGPPPSHFTSPPPNTLPHAFEFEPPPASVFPLPTPRSSITVKRQKPLVSAAPTRDPTSSPSDSSTAPSPPTPQQNTKSAPGGKKKEGGDGKKSTVELDCACTSCATPIAHLIMRGLKEEFDVPYGLAYSCFGCVPRDDANAKANARSEDANDSFPAASTSSSSQPKLPKPTSKGTFRKRTKRTDGTNLVACDVCLRDIASGAVLSLPTSSEVSFAVEVVCLSCSTKYRRCSDCGGGGGARLGVGKWRSRELFFEGRKTCRLSHLRLGLLSDMCYDIWRVGDIPREELEDVVEKCGGVFQNTMLAGMCVPEVMEPRAAAMATSYEGVITMATNGWGALQQILRHDMEGRTSIRRYLAIRTCVPNPRKGNRRKTAKDAVPEGPQPVRAVIQNGKDLAGLILCEYDLLKGALFFAVVVPWATGETYDSTTLLIQELLRRVEDDRASLNLSRTAQNFPPLPPVLHIWTMMFFNRDSRMMHQLTNRRGFSLLDDYVTQYPDTDRSAFAPIRPVYLPLDRQEGWHVLVRRQGGGDGSEPDWQPRASVKQMAGKRKEARGKVRKAGLGLAAMGE